MVMKYYLLDAGHMTEMAATNIYDKPEDHWSCKRSPDIWV